MDALAYETDGYTAEINGTWDIKKEIKNSKTPIRLKPTVGVAFAAHANPLVLFFNKLLKEK